jgi:hypothetical protein
MNTIMKDAARVEEDVKRMTVKKPMITAKKRGDAVIWKLLYH